MAFLLDVRGRTAGGDTAVLGRDPEVELLAADVGLDVFGGEGNVIPANIFGNPGDSGMIFSSGTARPPRLR